MSVEKRVNKCDDIIQSEWINVDTVDAFPVVFFYPDITGKCINGVDVNPLGLYYISGLYFIFWMQVLINGKFLIG